MRLGEVVKLEDLKTMGGGRCHLKVARVAQSGCNSHIPKVRCPLLGFTNILEYSLQRFATLPLVKGKINPLLPNWSSEMVPPFAFNAPQASHNFQTPPPNISFTPPLFCPFRFHYILLV